MNVFVIVAALYGSHKIKMADDLCALNALRFCSAFESFLVVRVEWREVERKRQHVGCV